VTHSAPPVAVVTGASRGAGRGIAAALVADGWRVYLTGRTVTDPGNGGIAVKVDHTDDAAVGALFARVEQESGRLDLLVNNAAAIQDDLTNPKPFWEKPLDLADVLDVGLRSAYVASWHAAPLMVRQNRGLIAFTSSPGSVCYMHGPAYGAQKAGVDKLAADMAVDFRDTGVATVSVWMGILLTERFRSAFTGHPGAFDQRAVSRPRPCRDVWARRDRGGTRATLRHHRRRRSPTAVAPGDVGRATGAEFGDCALSDNSRQVSMRARWANSSMGIVMNPWMPPL
jgi:NAD(P)-dependent dehydrogenase (short-subunit alcohol dehydrogenase family)